MHVIVDYNVGNLANVKEGFKRVGIDTVISKDVEVIRNADSIILPGVGAFKASMDALKASGLIDVILDHIKADKYVLGICLGMQLLYEFSEEFGHHEGLGIFKGIIKKIEGDVKIPHMGWNSLEILKEDPILKYVNNLEDVYFVHSYYANTLDQTLAKTKHGVDIPAIIKKGRVYATQFHPEKSGDVGLRLLKGYGELL